MLTNIAFVQRIGMYSLKFVIFISGSILRRSVEYILVGSI